MVDCSVRFGLVCLLGFDEVRCWFPGLNLSPLDGGANK